MATISAIDSLTDLLNNQVNLTNFNLGVMKGGGKPINLSKNRVNILKLILILIKLLKTDYKKKVKRGGDLNDTYSNAYYMGDLKFDNYNFPINQFPERDTY
uniref:Uncharacterized protein n=1 Tax=viral metagenome TaxID=1070528 RepID=A0A6C0CEX6_9ZZZZ